MTGAGDLSSPVVWTVGHSTRTLEEFFASLRDHRIELLADVRRFPGSRRQPQFGRAALEVELTRAGIDYEWMEGLGGRRKPRPDSRNLGWLNDGFRGYADYMQTPPFDAALKRLRDVAANQRTAIMCAEALWWQCHRRLIADALVARGWPVTHIVRAGSAEPHTLKPPARLLNGELSYVGESGSTGQPQLDL